MELNLKRKVLIKIKSVHQNDFEMETQCFGVCQKVGENIYIKFNEENEEHQMIENLLRINDVGVELIKKPLNTVKEGVSATKMIFIAGKSTEFEYCTPFGSLPMVIVTNHVAVHLKKDILFVMLQYDLYTDNEKISTCKIDIEATVLSK